jgi:hypothetical protein
MALKDKIRVRRDTTANFTSANPVLSVGEISFDTTTKQFKVGDGASTWTALPYSDAAATAFSISTALASYTPTSSLSAIATSGSASDLTAGTVPDDRLSAQVARRDQQNSWQQFQTFFGGVTINGTDGLAVTNGGNVLVFGTGVCLISSNGSASFSGNLTVGGSVIQTPAASTSLATNGQMVFERVSNTEVRLKLRGDDGATRSTILTLS